MSPRATGRPPTDLELATPLAMLASLADGGRPFVTAYGGVDGRARTELSVTTISNAVAKAAGLLRDGLGLTPGEASVSIDLPRHWQLPIWTMAALSVGARCGRHLTGSVDVRVVGPQVAESPAVADHVLVSSCDTFGMPVPPVQLDMLRAATSAEVLDIGVEVRAFPDRFLPEPDAGPAGRLDQVGVTEPDSNAPHWSVIARETSSALPHAARLWVDDGTPEPGLLVWAALVPLVLDGSVILTSGLSPSAAARIRVAERVSEVPSAGDPGQYREHD